VQRMRRYNHFEAFRAVLSNVSMVSYLQIIDAFSLIDMPIMKLDAGDEKTFRAVNRPIEMFQFEEILDGLESVPGLIIQSMMIDGDISNIHGHAYGCWASKLKDLHPLKVQIYSMDRPTAVGGVKQVSSELLTQIAHDLASRCQLDVEAFWRE